MYFSNFPLDQVHSQRRKAETEWNQRNYKQALQCFENAVAHLKEVLQLEPVRHDPSLFRTLECQLHDLQRQVRHCGVYVTRSDRCAAEGGRWDVPDDAKPRHLNASVRLETVCSVENYDFATDTLLSGLADRPARRVPQLQVGARKRPKELGELVEELRVAVAQKRRDLRHHVEELRKAKTKLGHNQSLRDFLRDRQRIREEEYDLTPPPSSPASHRLRHLASQRKPEERTGVGAESPEPPHIGAREPAPVSNVEPSFCTLVESRLCGPSGTDAATLGGSTLSWARPAKTTSESLLAEQEELSAALEKLREDLSTVVRDCSCCEAESAQLEEEIAELRDVLHLPTAPPLPEGPNSDSDPENCALLPLSLPPAFKVPRNLMPTGPPLLEE